MSATKKDKVIQFYWYVHVLTVMSLKRRFLFFKDIFTYVNNIWPSTDFIVYPAAFMTLIIQYFKTPLYLFCCLMLGFNC